MSETTGSYRPKMPSSYAWHNMTDVERVHLALQVLLDRVEHEHRPDRVRSVGVGDAVRLARSALGSAKDEGGESRG